MSDTKKQAFVIGEPINHSRSPLIHNHWIEINNVNGTYKKQKVTKNELKKFMTSVHKGKWIGGNVTLPHKETMLGLVDQCDNTAKRIGAVNTVWVEQKGKTKILVGGNTDAYGFAANLDEKSKGWDGKPNREKIAIVLGAGGAARAVVDALVERKFEHIVIANRTVERAENLAKHFGEKRCTGVALGEANKLTKRARLVVNTIPPTSKKTPISLKDANPKCLVTDIVYVPLQTPLIKQAKKLNLKTVDGLGMLLHQAVPGFQKWFGVRPEVTEEVRMLILRDLGEIPKPKKTLFVGVTGSMAMGKSTVANMFREMGMPVCDSDKIVHQLYQGKAVPIIQKMFGKKVVRNGKVDRKVLSKIVVGDEEKLKKLEAVIHPLVREEEKKFKQRVRRECAPLAVFDSPLLLERKNHLKVDKILVVTAPKKIQTQRAMKRPGMTNKKLEMLLSRQVDDKQKQQKADFVVDTSKSIRKVEAEIKKITKNLINT